jgi:hypothetical protein
VIENSIIKRRVIDIALIVETGEIVRNVVRDLSTVTQTAGEYVLVALM